MANGEVVDREQLRNGRATIDLPNRILTRPQSMSVEYSG